MVTDVIANAMVRVWGVGRMGVNGVWASGTRLDVRSHPNSRCIYQPNWNGSLDIETTGFNFFNMEIFVFCDASDDVVCLIGCNACHMSAT